MSKPEADNKSNMPSLDASGIAEYIRFDCCPRFFKLKFEGDEESDRKWPEAFKPLSPLLYGSGKDLEAAKIKEFQKKASEYHDLSKIATNGPDWQEPWTKSLRIIKDVLTSQLLSQNADPKKPVLLYQVPMIGHVGVWDVKGTCRPDCSVALQGWQG